MEIDALLKQAWPEKELVKAVLSNACDFGSSDGALISVKAFEELSDNLIRWQKSTVLKNYEKCLKEIYSDKRTSDYSREEVLLIIKKYFA